MNTFFLLLPAAALLGILAYALKIFPQPSLVLVALAPGLIATLLIVWPVLLEPLFVLDAIVLVVAAADLSTLPRRGDFFAERQTGRIASLGKPHRVNVTVANRLQRDRLITVRDGIPADLEAAPSQAEIVSRGRSRATVHYELTARRRGLFRLSGVYLRAQSRLRLWKRDLFYEQESVINVYPDMKQLSEYAILARTNRLSLMGVRRTRRIGQDNEFERLRDYAPDDNYKFIDWRSTARRNELTVKDFQANQSQRIVFLVDCGRMMTGQVAGISQLDHALNAVLMMSFVALRQGDQVGLLCFSDGIHGFVPPRGGMTQMNRLLHASFDRFPQMVESRYDQAFLYLAAHCRKRALVVLITNVIDEVNAHQIQQYLVNLVGRHLPLGVLLRDRRLFDAVEPSQMPFNKLPAGPFYRAAAAADIVTWRHQVLSDLQRGGVLALDVFPEEMTAPLVNRYLEIKARHLL